MVRKRTLYIMGLRERVWVKMVMNSLGSLVGSRFSVFASSAKTGMISQWLLYANASVFLTHTGSPVFASWSWFAASSVTRRRASSLSCGAQKNGLQGMWPSTFWLVRPHNTSRPRFVQRQHAGLSGVRGSPDSLSMLRQSETGTTRLSCRQPVLHEAVCLVRRASLAGG